MINSKTMPNYNWPMANSEHKPFKHQIETSEFLVKNPRCFVLNDLGTGKTLSALWAADFLINLGVVKKVLIIGPLSTLHSVWVNEIKQNFKHRTWAIAHGNSASDKIAAIKANVNFVIINHDGVKGYNAELLNQEFKLIIIDELTAFKNVGTVRWKMAKKICDKANGVWGMSADMTPNSPVEAFGQAKLVNPKNSFLPQYLTKFKDMVEHKITMFLTIPKDDADETVFKTLQPSIRFKRDDCVDIPECQYMDIQLTMSNEQQKVYKAIFEQLYIEYQEGSITASNSAVKLSKLLQIACGWVKEDSGDKIITLDVDDRLDQLYYIYENTHRNKLIIFSAFRASIFGIHDYFKKKNVKCEYIFGGTKASDRGKYIDQFQNGDLEVLIIQPQAAAHGITLTAASTIVWYSMIPSGEIYNQANGRITRIGQTKKQTIIHFISCKAEQHIRNILQRKGRMSQEILRLFDEV